VASRGSTTNVQGDAAVLGRDVVITGQNSVNVAASVWARLLALAKERRADFTLTSTPAGRSTDATPIYMLTSEGSDHGEH
jgi:hypothetical protein